MGASTGNAQSGEEPVTRSEPVSEGVHDLAAAVRLNLARALVKAGQPGRAAGLYGQLTAEGTLAEHGDVPEQALAWLSFGQALAGSGQPAQAESAFQRVMLSAASNEVRLGLMAYNFTRHDEGLLPGRISEWQLPRSAHVGEQEFCAAGAAGCAARALSAEGEAGRRGRTPAAAGRRHGAAGHPRVSG